jgi:hypothetical protein
MKRITIDPASFTDGQWEEFYNASGLMPRSYEARRNAKPFRRARYQIETAVQVLTNRAAEVMAMHDDQQWTDDLTAAADTLQELLGPPRFPTRSEASQRLRQLLNSDIYTDAPEYADRVQEIFDLMPIVFDKPRKRKPAEAAK